MINVPLAPAMISQSVILLIFFVSVNGNAIEEFFSRVNDSSLSGPCQNDIATWREAMRNFEKELLVCAADKKKCQTKDLGYNILALKQLDAFGRLPAGFLDLTLTSPGSISECKEVGANFAYETKYCYLNSYLTSKCKKGFPVIRKAICMPRSCTDEDLLSIFNRTILPYCSVDCLPDESHTNVFFWIFISFMLVLIAICLLSTVIDYLSDSTECFGSEKSTGLELLLMFSFYTNGAAILDTTPARQGHLRSVDCIRFLSMLWVVSGHVMELWLHNDNLYVLGKVGDPIMADTLTNGFFSVDTFFTLSGMMVAYLFFKTVSKDRNVVKNPFTWILFYVHRYLRLTPPYILFIGFYIAFVPLMKGLAIIDFGLLHSVDTCKKYWWKNMLYFNNFDDATDCYGHTWYLAADFQLYVVAPFFLLCFYFKHILGAFSVILACAGSVGITFGIVYHYDIGVSLVRYQTEAMFSKKLYHVPWIRCTPYLVGIWAGYILATKKLTDRKRWYSLVAMGLWAAGIAVALACIYGAHNYLDFHKDWDKFTRSFYYSFSRIGWGLFVCWVVLANFYGYGGPIAKLMEHPLWQPLGRLSFAAYLVHRFCLYYFLNLLDKPVHFNTIWQQFLGYTIPITVMAYVLAFVWSCLCEVPILKLEKFCIEKLMALGKKSRKDSKEHWKDEK